MSNFLDSLEVVNGAVKAPYLGIIYGKGGLGKSWLASYSEDPFYVPLEAGCNLIPAKKFNVKPRDVDEFFDMLRYFIKNPQACRTVIIDSLGFFQSMVYTDIIKNKPTTGGKSPRPVSGIGDYDYHAGYSFALPYWEKLIAAVDAIQGRGMNVIMITHSQLKNRPSSGESYKAEDFALQSPNNGDVTELLRRRCDWCLFMDSEAKTRNKAGGYGGTTTVPIAGSRPDIIVNTRATSEFFAKVRTSAPESIEDYYLLDSSNIDASSKKIIDAVTGANL